MVSPTKTADQIEPTKATRPSGIDLGHRWCSSLQCLTTRKGLPLLYSFNERQNSANGGY